MGDALRWMRMNESYVREFLRESNRIEGVYDESADDSAWDAFCVLADRREHPLSPQDVKDVHQVLLGERQPDIAGGFREAGVRVSGYVAPPADRVPGLMAELLDWFPEGPVDALAWHREFEKIHPFRDGNGRAGRIVYVWHCQQLNVKPVMFRASDRDGYYGLFK